MVDNVQSFLEYALKICKTNPRARAAFRRAANPATEFYSWEFLAGWCNLENDKERKIYGLFASFIANAMPSRVDNGVGIGRGIRQAYGGDVENTAALAKMRRLLACRNWEEAVSMLWRILLLLASKGVSLNLVSAMRDLFYFGEKVKVRWANDFYQAKNDGEK